MSARSSEPRRPQRGFTLVELIAVLLLLGVLSAMLLPRLGGAFSLRDAAWRDQVLAALQHARTLAAGHRRLVCASVATGEVRLAIAAANPASSCGSVLNGADGDARWAHDGNATAIVQSPAGTLYFQPDGRITSDGAGATPVDVSIAITGQPAIQLRGATGHVQ